MKEIVINTSEVRRGIGYIETKNDIMTALREVDYLADEATARLEFAIIEANEALFSIRALANRPIIEKPADQL